MFKNVVRAWSNCPHKMYFSQLGPAAAWSSVELDDHLTGSSALSFTKRPSSNQHCKLHRFHNLGRSLKQPPMFRFLRHLTHRKTPKQLKITTMYPAGMHSWRRGEVEPQEYYTFRNGLWQPIEGPQTSDSETAPPRSLHFSVLSWNIDFMRAHDEARMAAALAHLHSLVSARPNHPSVIMLNEMTKSDLQQIKQADWVRAGYHMTDVSPAHWESPAYGTSSFPPRQPQIYNPPSPTLLTLSPLQEP